MKRLSVLMGLLCGLMSEMRGQGMPFNPLFDDTRVNEVHLTMNSSDLEALYADPFSGDMFEATLMFFDGATWDTVPQVGVRLRGNTSLGSAKKSFKILFDGYQSGRKYHGVERLNLNGSHNDPSMMREKVFYDVWNSFGLPTRRAAFVKVFINGDYYGLYTNIEEVDEIWLKDRFGNNEGSLYKCVWPADLKYLGSDPADYIGTNAYELKSSTFSDDYTDLVDFITTLNQTSTADFPCDFDAVFEVDEFLKAYAVEVALGHWDNYGYNKNNFFLYRNLLTGKFHFVSYDADNTLGIDFMNINWTTRNIYTWHSSDASRPLVSKLLSKPEYRDKFTFFMEELVEQHLNTSVLFPHIDSLHALITPAAEDDPYRDDDYGFSWDDFLNATTQGTFPAAFGIKPYITARNQSTLQQLDYQLQYVQPYLRPEPPKRADGGVLFRIETRDALSGDACRLVFSADSVSWQTLDMFDDGLHADGLAGDRLFGLTVPLATVPQHVYYHYEVSNQGGNTVRAPRCYDQHFQSGKLAVPIVINELMSDNVATLADDSGAFDDWLEVFNLGTQPVPLHHLYLSDNPDNPAKWRMPDVAFAAGAYAIFWLDNDPDEGPYHADFRLASDGEHIGIYGSVFDDYAPIDSVTFPALSPDASYSRLPNGSGPFFVTQPATPNGFNIPTATDDLANAHLTVYPNPTAGRLFILSDAAATWSCSAIATDGRVIELGTGTEVDLSSLPSGVYVLRIMRDGQLVATRSIVRM